MTQEIIIPKNLNEVDAAIFLVKVSDQANAMSRELLFRINNEKLWQDRFSSWNEFVESPEGLGKSASWASKQLSIHDCYYGKVSQRKLESIDSERLYLAIRLPGTPEEKLTKAELWGRSEIRDQLASTSEGDCQHDCEHVTLCSRCSRRV